MTASLVSVPKSGSCFPHKHNVLDHLFCFKADEEEVNRLQLVRSALSEIPGFPVSSLEHGC